MSQQNTCPNYQTSRIYSAGFISNPYTSFRSCCLSFNIKALQIGFYFALISYILLPLVLFQVPNQRCEPYSKFYNGTFETGEICRKTEIVEGN
uniref:Transmembrane protein n=1 Tax=Meloidogyne hapla TaxID=6305 RepID=A0A1I8B0W3_MELHA